LLDYVSAPSEVVQFAELTAPLALEPNARLNALGLCLGVWELNSRGRWSASFWLSVACC